MPELPRHADPDSLTERPDQVDSPQDVAGSIYESGEYLERNPTFHTEDSAWKAQKIYRLIEKTGLRPGRIADIGCGAGGVLAELQRHLPPETVLHGYDISPQGIELARPKANDRLQFFQADLLATEHEPYDLLLCIDVFEHVPDYLGFLRALRPHANRHIFHIPLDLSVQTVLRDSLTIHRNQFGHLHYFSPGTAFATLTDCGYEVVDHIMTAGGIELAHRPKQKILRIPRQLLSLISPRLCSRLLGGYSLLVLTR